MKKLSGEEQNHPANDSLSSDPLGIETAGRPLIAYISAETPENRRAWSGTHWYAGRAVDEEIGDLLPFGPIRPPIHTLLRGAGKLSLLIARRRYPVTHNWLLARAYAEIISTRIEVGRRPDILLGVSASAEVAALETDIPIVLFADATFSQMSEYYGTFSRMPDRFKREADSVERAAIQRATCLVYASEWAAESAVRDYGADSARVSVIPFGANLDIVPDAATAISKPRADRCRLLFVGVDWQRKGGAIAFDAFLELEKRGLAHSFTVVGCTPPDSYAHPSMTVIPHLDKNDPAQMTQLSNIYLESHLFLLPTRAEAAGIVFAEASAHGLPSISTHTGGVPTMVLDGVNGLTLPYEATGADYADAIEGVWRDQKAYRELVRSSRKRYDEALNWQAWGRSMNTIISPFIGRAAREG